MKADGGALVYILIAIISLVVSAISKNNEKKAKRPAPPVNDAPEWEEVPQPQASRPKTTWHQEFEEIFGEVTKPVYKEYSPEEIKPEFDKEPEYLGSQESIIANEAEEEIKPGYVGEAITENESSVYFHQHSGIIESLEEEQEMELQPVAREDFDLRKAVIYSEVINRKYF